MNSEIIGSAGTLVCAGLATAGQFLQSSLLDLFERGLLSAFGVLLFVISALTGFALIAIGGRYQTGLTLLIGPTLFMAAIAYRVPSRGTEWRFGERKHPQAKVMGSLTGIYDWRFLQNLPDEAKLPENSPIQVSWVFAKWDELTSGITQMGISALGLLNVKGDLTFLSRTAKYQSLFNLGIVDSRVQELVHVIMLEKCADWLGLHAAKADPESAISISDIDRQLAYLEELTVITSADPGYTIIRDLNADQYFLTPPEPLQPSYTCPGLWDLTIQALRKEALNSSAMIAEEERPDDMTADEEFLNLAIKFSDGDEDIADPAADESIAKMVNGIAIRMLHAAFKDRYQGMSARDLLNPSRRSDGKPNPYRKDDKNITQDIRQAAGAEADAGQGEVFGFVVGLPYLQGLTLALLALSYPLFALLLVMPGRAEQFVIWMSLWAWVKLWDFGFAVVMLIDQLLWYLLPSGPALTEAEVYDPTRSFEVIFSADPTYDLSIYWNVMAMLLASVPVFTGFLVYRSGRNIIGFATSASSQYSRHLASSFRQAGGQVRTNLKSERDQAISRLEGGTFAQNTTATTAGQFAPSVTTPPQTTPSTSGATPPVEQPAINYDSTTQTQTVSSDNKLSRF